MPQSHGRPCVKRARSAWGAFPIDMPFGQAVPVRCAPEARGLFDDDGED